MTEHGDAALGRGVVVAAGGELPAAWSDAPTVTLDEACLADPQQAVERLHDHWSRRHPVVVVLDVDADRFRAPSVVDVPAYSLDPGLQLWRDRLHFLVWQNNYDARGQRPVWWWGVKAQRLGAAVGETAGVDVVLQGGQHARIDGGPRGPIAGLAEGTVVVHAETVASGRLDPDRYAPPGDDLDAEQLEAVGHRAGPARVIAPAGSGKTRALTARLRHLLADRGWRPEHVLAVAYNVQAAQEMRDRTSDLVPAARVQTLNGLGYAVLREHRRDLEVLGEREVRDLVARCFPVGRQRRTNVDPIAPYLEALTAVRLGLRDPRTVEDERDDVAGLAAGFDGFRAALADAGAVDFDEQVYGAVELLLRDPVARAAAQVRHRHLLVDELQDLTPAHVLLIRLLAGPPADVFGVGDDDQVIYGYAGAHPRFLVEFSDYFPGAHHHALVVDYRCPSAVVAAARNLLSWNRYRVPKEIRAAPDAVPSSDALRVVRHAPTAGPVLLAETVRDRIEEGVPSDRIAVLARVNSLLLGPHMALRAAGVPVASLVGADVLAHTGVAAALAYLRVAAAPTAFAPADLLALYRRPSRGLPQWIQRWFRGRRSWSVDALREVGERIDDARVRAKLHDLAGDLDGLAAVAGDGGTTRDLLVHVRDVVGLGRAMELLDGSKGALGGTHIDDLEGLLQAADLHGEAGSFEAWLRATLAEPPAAQGVTLATVHKVKGREWEHVVVTAVNDGIVPHRLSADEEEERRILHVAITRGSRGVVLLADADRPSPFLAQLDRERPVGEELPPRPASRRSPAAVQRLPAPACIAPDAATARLAERLRDWRRARARGDGVPAYVVLADRTLDEIAAGRPRGEPELLACHGIGPTKLERYGDEILAIVADDAATGAPI